MTGEKDTDLAELVAIYEAALTLGVARQLSQMLRQLQTVRSQSDQWMSEAARHKREIALLRARLGE